MIRQMLVILILLVVPLCAQAQVILGSLPQSNDNTQTAAVTDQRQKAFRFTMPNTGFDAGDLELRLRNYDAPGEAIAELRDFTGSTTAPGANVLMSFAAPAPGAGAIENFIFTPTSSFTLQPNTTYWLVVRGVAGGTFDWMASSPGITPTGLAMYDSTSFTTNGGGTWSNSTILNSFEFRVVPEPASLLSLIVMLAAGLGHWRRMSH